VLTNYERLVVKLVCLVTDGLPLPDPDMIERNEERVAIEVCRWTKMTPDVWANLTEVKREPWIQNVLDMMEKEQPSRKPRGSKNAVLVSFAEPLIVKGLTYKEIAARWNDANPGADTSAASVRMAVQRAKGTSNKSEHVR